VKTDLVVKSPTKGVEMPNNRKIETGLEVLTHAEIQRLIAAAKEDTENFIFVFAIFTGLREGEICALTYDDIDMQDDLISVTKTCSYLTVDGKYSAVLRSAKNDSSIREVPILPDLKPLLQAHIEAEKEKCLRLDNPFVNKNPVFTNGAYSYVEGSNLRKRFYKLLKLLGIEKRNFHKLRHTFCTLLAENDVPLVTASRLMGHSDIRMTAQVYSHVNKDEKRRGINKLSAVFQS
jgi:integrase